MAATKRAMDPTVIELFTKATASTSWGTIDDLYNAVTKDGDLVELLLKGDVSQRVIKQEIRKLIKKVKNPDNNHAAFASVSSTDDEGNKVTLYKQETLFDTADYEQVVEFHNHRVVHHATEATYFRRRCHQKFSVQPKLAFDERSILFD
ncbi:MAG: hypothetical protein KF855_03505 [Acidobacteria bacterium]|nr:hypothetical protein [Acidobacteriota bacterium]